MISFHGKFPGVIVFVGLRGSFRKHNGSVQHTGVRLVMFFHVQPTALMIVVTFGLVFVRLWLIPSFALAINLVTGWRHAFKNQIVRVLGDLEADHASLHGLY